MTLNISQMATDTAIPFAAPAPHRLSPFLAHQPSRHWKSQIAHSDMHHPICGINSRILSVSLASHVSTHLLIHLSGHLYYHHHSHHPSLLHSFTPGSKPKPTFSTNPSHLRFLLPTGLPSWQRDWTGPITLIALFLVSHFNFLFVPYGGLSFLLHVKYTLSYRITRTVTRLGLHHGLTPASRRHFIPVVTLGR